MQSRVEISHEDRYLSAFILSQLYRRFPLVVTPSDRGLRSELFTAVLVGFTIKFSRIQFWYAWLRIYFPRQLGRLLCMAISSPQCFRAL